MACRFGHPVMMPIENIERKKRSQKILNGRDFIKPGIGEFRLTLLRIRSHVFPLGHT
jgi:hypothetical protein